ncbi:MAG: mucoidy inhibitor MuiA family protein [Microcoleaceae cyanobacterium]
MEQRYTVDTQITAVTVYTNHARITRRGRTQLSGEESELVITGLPTLLQPESVRARGQGSSPVQLLSLRTEKIFTIQSINEQVAEIQAQIDQLETEKRQLQARTDAAQLQQSFINRIGEQATSPFAESLATEETDLEKTGKLLHFLGKRYREYSASIIDYEIQQEELEQRINAQRKALQRLQQIQPAESFDLVIAIACPAGNSGRPSEFELEVSYTISQASWRPLYDFRVASQCDRLHLTYLAEVIQTTGEDWQDIRLTLSTAKPGLGTLPPRLDPWYIDLFTPQPAPIMLRSRALGAPAPTGTFGETAELSDEFGMATAASESGTGGTVPAQSSKASIGREGNVVTFSLRGKGNIPSDGNPHTVNVFEDDYPSSPQYVAIPKLVSFAYLQTRIVNPTSGVTLLPGKANVFRENVFVGVTHLNNIVPGQEFLINLGIDEGITIERHLIERQVDKKIIGGQRVITYAYRILLKNLQNQPRQIKVQEQLPVSRNEQVKIRLLQARPKIELGEMGLLEWIL